MFTGTILILASLMFPNNHWVDTSNHHFFLNNNDTITNQNVAGSTNKSLVNEIKELVDGVVGYKENGLWGLQNNKGEAITPPKYSSVEKINRYIKASMVGKTSGREFFGVITTNDEIIIPFEYVALEEGGDRVIAIHQSGRNLNVGLISYSHNILVPFKYYNIQKLSRTRFAVEDYEGRIALFSDTGQKLTAFDIDSIGRFQGDYAKIYSKAAVGLLNQGGAITMEPKYKEISISDSEEISYLEFPVWERYAGDSRQQLNIAADKLTPVAESTLIVERNNKYQIVKTNGFESNLFDFIDILSPNAWHVMSEGKHGIADSTGHFIVPMEYDSMRIDKEFAYAYYDGEGSLTGWNIFDIYGTKRSRYVYEDVESYGDGLFPVKRNGKWGFMNRKGQEVIYCVYDEIKVFSRDLITVSFHGESGVIDRKGNWIITPNKGDLELIDREYFLLHTPRETRFYKTPGELIYFTQNPIRNVDGYLLEEIDSGTYWQIDYDGVRIQESSIDDMYPIYKDSVYVINDRGRVGLRVRGKQDVFFSPDYQSLFPPSEGLMKVRVDDRYGFVDFDGKLRIAHRYDRARDFHLGLAAIELRGRWGFINKQEEIAIQPLFESVTDFSNGLSKVEKNNLFGLIDTHGELIEDIQFEKIEVLETGHFLVTKQGLTGLLDDKGEIIISPKYDEIIDPGNGELIVSKGSFYGIVNISGVDILPARYSIIQYDPFTDTYLIAQRQEIRKQKK